MASGTSYANVNKEKVIFFREFKFTNRSNSNKSTGFSTPLCQGVQSRTSSATNLEAYKRGIDQIQIKEPVYFEYLIKSNSNISTGFTIPLCQGVQSRTSSAATSRHPSAELTEFEFMNLVFNFGPKSTVQL